MTDKTSPDGFDIEDHLPYRISMLTNLIRQATTDKYIRQSNISGREWRVLSMIGIKGPMSAVDVVELTGMDKATITRAGNRLLKLDLLHRETDATDRRRKVLSLTSKGQTECHRIIPMMAAGGDSFDSALSERERTQLYKILDKIKAVALAQL